MKVDATPEYVKKRALILGSGNLLFGDDGFGPATAEYIQKKCEVPNDVYVMDVGTGASRVLFELTLSEKKPKKIVILDAIDLKRKPGEIFEIQIEDLPENKLSSFSSHLFPATNLLKELRDAYGVDVSILACQIKRIPELVKPGLSEPVKKSVPKAAKIALRLARVGKATS
ncbi:MAG: hydrogenase maturation protease [Candidatus Bathyarchaeia archaeon]